MLTPGLLVSANKSDGMPRPTEDESTVTADFSITVPPAIRERVRIQAGDTVRWHVDDGKLTIHVVERAYGAFSDLEPIDVQEDTDAAVDHDRVVERE